MKKIIFNDKYGLTQAVIQGRKTMIRMFFDYKKVSKYKVGEVVAVAQSYKSVYKEMMNGDYENSRYDALRCSTVFHTKGWNNKMFVRAELMPHHIRITSVRVEHLQDISVEDLEREGVEVRKYEISGNEYVFYHPNPYGNGNSGFVRFYSLQAAARAFFNSIWGKYKLIDNPWLETSKVNPWLETWKDNPWVFVYEFELIR